MIVNQLKATYTQGGACNTLARQAIRLGFHDAATWNTSLSTGGADGSIVLNTDESARSENRGLQTIIDQMRQWYTQWQKYDISMADLIQMSAMTATVTCPGGPRIKAFVGRDDNDALPPDGLIPSPFSDAKTNIALFQAKTFTASDLVALVGAHTVSQQFFVDPSQAGKPQDTTNTVWDVKFYSDTLSASTPDGTFRFPSDLSLSNSSDSKATWQAFTTDQNGWNTVSKLPIFLLFSWIMGKQSTNTQDPQAYAAAYFRMSMLGVKNLNDMTDCSVVLPKGS